MGNTENKKAYVYIKIHKVGRIRILAVCDVELLGKKFKDGGLQLEVSVRFYGGEKVPLDDKLFRLIEEAEIVNMVGERVISEAIKRGIVCKEGVIRIANIPHVQIIKDLGWY